MNEKLIKRPKSLDDAIEMAKKTPSHAVKFNAQKWSITVIVEKDGEIKEFKLGDKKAKKQDNWLNEFADAGLLKDDSRDDFIKRIKKFRKNSSIIKFSDK